MSLRSRLEAGQPNAQTTRSAYAEFKKRLHHNVLDALDITRLQKLDGPQLAVELQSIVEQLMREESAPLTEGERRNLVREIQWEMTGFGPLEPLLADPGISDILVNTHSQVYVERSGRLLLTDVVFNDEPHLMRIIEKIVSHVGRRIDESSPMVDARLPDG